jgi:cytochrome c-type biogenesis protein CcmH/NrfF
MRTRIVAAAVGLTLGLFSLAAWAEPSRRAAELSSQIMSPFCPGKTLDSCTSPNAAEWRGEIRQWVDEGVSSDEIRRRLEQRAGAPLRTTPVGSHASFMVVATALLGGGILVVFGHRVLRRPRTIEAATEGSAADGVSDERLDQELALLDE